MKSITLNLKQTLWATSFAALICFSPLPSDALTVEEVPNPRQEYGGWVTDMAAILSEDTESQLNQMISELEQQNGVEIAVVTVPETQPSATPKEFTTALFNHWGIGKAGEDNGVLFLVSVGDRRTEIETGYGVEAILPDAKVGNIIDTKITPEFKQGNFDRGTLAGTGALIVALEPSLDSSITVDETTEDTIPWIPLAGGGGLALLLGSIGSIALWRRSRRVWVNPRGKTRIDGNGDRPVYCVKCRKPMQRLDESQLLIDLTKPEKVAQKLGSLKFEQWQCPNCSRELAGEAVQTIAYASKSSQYRTCPTCQELTVRRTKKIIQHATQWRSGKRLITDICHCCDYLKSQEEIIPRLSSSTYISSSSSSSSSYSSGSSSGGSFGGGDSGGGGAGGSW